MNRLAQKNRLVDGPPNWPGEAYSRDSGSRLATPWPEAFFSQYLCTQASQLFPAAVSLPVKASAAISAYAIFIFLLESWGKTRTKLVEREEPATRSKI